MQTQKKKGRDVKRLYRPPPEQDYSSNYIRLVVVIVISIIFIGGEVVAGIIANSIAIISDAVHLVSDTIAFIFSILFLYLSKKRPNTKMTFGYHRMELLGALANIFIIWFLIIFVMYEATLRVIAKEFVEKPFVMLIAAGGGLVVNIAMYKVLHGGATHSHGLLADACHGHDHDHGHEHKHQHKHEDKHDHDHQHQHQHQDQHEHQHQLDHKHQHKPKHEHQHKHQHQHQNQHEHQHKHEDEHPHAHQVKLFGHSENKHEHQPTPAEYQEDICEDDFCNSKGPGIHYHQAPLPPPSGALPQRQPQLQPLLANEESPFEAPPAARLKDTLQNDYCSQEHEHYSTCYLKPQRKELMCMICSGKHHTSKHELLKNNRKGSQDGSPLKFSPKKYKSEHGEHEGHDHHQHEHGEEDKDRMASIGMQAAILHALSDMIMSVGLIISSLVIFFLGTPNGRMEDVTEWNPWHLFDPIATYIFSVVSLASTIPVIKNSYYLLMESTPSYINIEKLQQEFQAIDGVIDVHDIHVWDLKPGKTMVIAHVLAKTNTEREVLIQLSDIVREKKIYHSTFQVQEQMRKQDPDYILCHHDIH